MTNQHVYRLDCVFPILMCLQIFNVDKKDITPNWHFHVFWNYQIIRLRCFESVETVYLMVICFYFFLLFVTDRILSIFLEKLEVDEDITENLFTHPFLMDDLKIFTKSWVQINSLVYTVIIFCQKVGIGFWTSMWNEHKTLWHKELLFIVFHCKQKKPTPNQMKLNTHNLIFWCWMTSLGGQTMEIHTWQIGFCVGNTFRRFDHQSVQGMTINYYQQQGLWSGAFEGHVIPS